MTMTITSLSLANFKAFAAAQRVPLRPITLAYGANSSGKSSVLHALALAHHAIETGNLDMQRTQVGGETIDLGGFHQYVHRRERERQVELGFELDPERLSGHVAKPLRSAREIVVELAIGKGITSDQQTLFGDKIRELDQERSVRLERFAVEVDGAPLLSMSARAGGLLRLDRLDHSHPIFQGILRQATTTQEIHEADFVALGKVFDELVPGITAKRRGLFPQVDNEFERDESEGEGWETSVPGRHQEGRERLLMPKALRELVGGLSSAIEDEIRRLRYLGPLRSYPPRHLAFSQHHDPNWLAGGGYAWDVVSRDEDVRRRVNAWLGDPKRLQTPYELVVRDLLPSNLVAAELPSRLASDFHDLLMSMLWQPDRWVQYLWELAEDGWDDDYGESEYYNEFSSEIVSFVAADVDTDAISQRWIQEIAESRPEVLQDLVLIDKRTSTPVSHRDVGIGVSQVLPVLVSAYASKNNSESTVTG